MKGICSKLPVNVRQRSEICRISKFNSVLFLGQLLDGTWFATGDAAV